MNFAFSLKTTLKIVLGVATLSALMPAQTKADEHTLYREPTISKKHVVFAYAGDLWRVDKSGGEAERLTTGVGIERTPYFSPDGKKVAFTGQYDGNTDVYVVDINGGTPERLTYHPGADTVAGWSRDGNSVLFSSPRNSHVNILRLFTVPLDKTTLPKQLPLPTAERGSYSPKGDFIAYEPLNQWQQAWKRYQGGQQDKIWIADLSDSSIEKVPYTNSSDKFPMWINKKVYFVSDRDSDNGDFRLFSYDPKKKEVEQVLKDSGMDIKSASAGPDNTIVFDQFGTINIFNTKSGKAKKIDISLNADVASVRPHFKNVGSRIVNAHISPNGKRAVFEARGEILTVPAKKGDIRNISRTTDAMDRNPVWSPDGQHIAYFSDQTGEYALHVRDQKGHKEPRIIELPNMFYRVPVWSPNSEKITFRDHGNVLWYVDLTQGDDAKAERIDKNILSTGDVLDVSWSPESDWITYAKQLPNLLRAIYVYSFKDQQAHQITDGLSDARHPTFDSEGKYIYFTASTNIAETISFADMSGLGRTTSRSIYAAVLSQETMSPLAPESDDEAEIKKDEDKETSKEETSDEKSNEEEESEEKEEEVASLKIDLDGILHRIVAMPADNTTWVSMHQGAGGTMYAVESVASNTSPGSLNIHKFDPSKKSFSRVTRGLRQFEVSANGKSALVRKNGNSWSIVKTSALGKSGNALNTSSMQVRVEPEKEWKQMFHEVWRGERDFLYDQNLHGLNLDWAIKTYEPFLKSVKHRSDLDYLFTEMLGQLTVGHMFVGGGDQARADRVPGGLLGADYSINKGRYQFSKIYNGENWSPRLVAPLNQPGLNVKVGDYVIAVNGIELTAKQNIFAAFEATAGKQTRLKVANNPEGKDAREIIVQPIRNERNIRNIGWVEENRRKVDEISEGKLAYIYMPNTAGAGFSSFNRYFYAQTDKQGAVLDERFNGGGLLADYVTQTLTKTHLANIFYRHGDTTVPVPAGAIYGPKAMIINELAGSGGDAMPWFFSKDGVGKLFGKRTWGGLVAAQALPILMDGGNVRAPDFAIFGRGGEWEIENAGMAPDVEIEFDPELWRQGRDPQLEATVEHLMQELKENPVEPVKIPKAPNYFN